MLEIWLANGDALQLMALGFQFSATAAVSWISPYGNQPTGGPFVGLVQEEDDALNRFNLPALIVGVIYQPDTLIFGGAATNPDFGMPEHDSHKLCYTLKFQLGGAAPETAGFCIDNINVTSTADWQFDHGNGPFPPNFQGQPNTSLSILDAPAVCFDIIQRSYVKGDADGNGLINISDAVYIIAYIFLGGPAPSPIESGGADCSGFVSVSDPVYIINYIFAGGPAPC